MKFEVENKDKVAIVKSKVEKLDAMQAPDFKAEFVTLNRSGDRNLIFDLSETRYCDSSGLSSILVANRLCRDSEGVFVLCGLQPAVAKLISISQLDSVLNITTSVDEAVDFVRLEEVERNV